MDHFFSTTYETARTRFRDALKQAGGQLTSYAVDTETPDSGASLTIDVGTIGDAASAKSVVISSGVHGVEGFFGSAIQTAYLERYDELASPEGVRTILVHAVNPYGFAELRRWNEDNVDLNRNFLAPNEPYQGQPDGYEQLHSFLNPASPPQTIDTSMLRLTWLLASLGFRALADAVAVGQYEHPRGLFFGGSQPTASHCLLRDHVDRWLGDADEIVHIDLHSGLGKFSQYKILVPPTLTPATWAEQVFGADQVLVLGQGKGAYRARGALTEWMTRALPNRSLKSVVAEFGTYSSIRVLNALRRENRAFYYAERGSAAYRSAKQELVECFCPASERWRQRVLESGLQIICQAANAVAPTQQPVCR